MNNSTTILNPELFNSFLHRKTINFTQVIEKNFKIKRTKTLATFVPEEIIMSFEPTKKILRKFSGILLLVDISGDGLLVLWKVHKNILIFQLIENIIVCSLSIHETLKSVNNETLLNLKVKTVISTGHIIFSVIGNEKSRHIIVAGPSVMEVKSLKNNCTPGDLILTANAWEHCAPSNYEYVIKAENSVQIIGRRTKNFVKRKMPFEINTLSRKKAKFSTSFTTNLLIPKTLIQDTFSHFVPNFRNFKNANNYQKPFTGRLGITKAVQNGIGDKLKLFIINSVVKEIENNQSLDNLTEIKRVTILSVNVNPLKSSVLELIKFIDDCYIQISKYCFVIFFKENIFLI
ncbi:adenylate cyclase type 10-like isoform X2 [Leptopilina boulardi]|uniref:adenylate cyclase type 10-like isoform X2 n=1 Tax=Leptopilina boulardi TaxID=63433 RepID=UPI0021F52EDA|nr:adenylate cyclase type 10-like isoform X2 [Leptopilina boulardi]